MVREIINAAFRELKREFTAEEIDATLCQQPAQVRLEGDIMKITPLN